jgi:EAL domain-containing protein (putative c-di-GMP-specific phosphodiesterase class I)
LYSIDFIKIDQSFVSDLRETSKNMALCRSMIHMAHELGMKVVAEGVESAEQRDLLIQAGCDFGQGYLFAHPLTPLQLEDLLREPPPLTNSN